MKGKMDSLECIEVNDSGGDRDGFQFDALWEWTNQAEASVLSRHDGVKHEEKAFCAVGGSVEKSFFDFSASGESVNKNGLLVPDFSAEGTVKSEQRLSCLRENDSNASDNVLQSVGCGLTFENMKNFGFTYQDDDFWTSPVKEASDPSNASKNIPFESFPMPNDATKCVVNDLVFLRDLEEYGIRVKEEKSMFPCRQEELANISGKQAKAVPSASADQGLKVESLVPKIEDKTWTSVVELEDLLNDQPMADAPADPRQNADCTNTKDSMKMEQGNHETSSDVEVIEIDDDVEDTASTEEKMQKCKSFQLVPSSRKKGRNWDEAEMKPDVLAEKCIEMDTKKQKNSSTSHCNTREPNNLKFKFQRSRKQRIVPKEDPEIIEVDDDESELLGGRMVSDGELRPELFEQALKNCDKLLNSIENKNSELFFREIEKTIDKHSELLSLLVKEDKLTKCKVEIPDDASLRSPSMDLQADKQDKSMRRESSGQPGHDSRQGNICAASQLASDNKSIIISGDMAACFREMTKRPNVFVPGVVSQPSFRKIIPKPHVISKPPPLKHISNLPENLQKPQVISKPPPLKRISNLPENLQKKIKIQQLKILPKPMTDLSATNSISTSKVNVDFNSSHTNSSSNLADNISRTLKKIMNSSQNVSTTLGPNTSQVVTSTSSSTRQAVTLSPNPTKRPTVLHPVLPGSLSKVTNNQNIAISPVGVNSNIVNIPMTFNPVVNTSVTLSGGTFSIANPPITGVSTLSSNIPLNVPTASTRRSILPKPINEPVSVSAVNQITSSKPESIQSEPGVGKNIKVSALSILKPASQNLTVNPVSVPGSVNTLFTPLNVPGGTSNQNIVVNPVTMQGSTNVNMSTPQNKVIPASVRVTKNTSSEIEQTIPTRARISPVVDRESSKKVPSGVLTETKVQNTTNVQNAEVSNKNPNSVNVPVISQVTSVQNSSEKVQSASGIVNVVQTQNITPQFMQLATPGSTLNQIVPINPLLLGQNTILSTGLNQSIATVVPTGVNQNTISANPPVVSVAGNQNFAFVPMTCGIVKTLSRDFVLALRPDGTQVLVPLQSVVTVPTTVPPRSEVKGAKVQGRTSPEKSVEKAQDEPQVVCSKMKFRNLSNDKPALLNVKQEVKLSPQQMQKMKQNLEKMERGKLYSKLARALVESKEADAACAMSMSSSSTNGNLIVSAGKVAIPPLRSGTMKPAFSKVSSDGSLMVMVTSDAQKPLTTLMSVFGKVQSPVKLYNVPSTGDTYLVSNSNFLKIIESGLCGEKQTKGGASVREEFINILRDCLLFSADGTSLRNPLVRSSCRCMKSKCLDNCCPCYVSLEACNFCDCESCHNNSSNESERRSSYRMMRIGDIVLGGKGFCSCSGGGCDDSSCECYESKSRCHPGCQCSSCRNRIFNDTKLKKCVVIEPGYVPKASDRGLSSEELKPVIKNMKIVEEMS